jgi:hypothetical protein
MRVIWLVGGHDTHVSLWQSLLVRERTNHEYLVRRADTLGEIPEEHLHHPGTIVLLDAFHPFCAGFTAFEHLQQAKTQAQVFLLGEPASELIAEPYKFSFFKGYFPPLARVDHAFLCGTIHHTLFYDHDIDLKNFLQKSGKASSEEIQNMQDFERFEKLLLSFLQKFGVDLTKTSKLLKGLTLPHGKSQGGKLEINAPFKIHFGIDPLKLVLAISSYSKGVAFESIQKDFIGSIQALGKKLPPPNSIFPEFFHSIQHSETLLFFHGSAKKPSDHGDPVYLVTRLTFPKKQNENTGSGYCFSFTHVEPTDEMTEELARKVVEATDGPIESTKIAEVIVETTPARTSASTVKAKDLEDILKDPPISGDKPLESRSSNVVPLRPGDNTPTEAPPANTEEIQKLNLTIQQLNQVCSELSKDLLHLMKMRREATTDKELKDRKDNLEKKLEQLNAEVRKLNDTVDAKDKSIAELQEKIDKLMSEAA